MSRWLARAREIAMGTPVPKLSKSPKCPPGTDFGTNGNFGTAPAISRDDWQAHFDERDGIREFDGGLPRSDAEALALQDTIAALGPRSGGGDQCQRHLPGQPRSNLSSSTGPEWPN